MKFNKLSVQTVRNWSSHSGPYFGRKTSSTNRNIPATMLQNWSASTHRTSHTLDVTQLGWEIISDSGCPSQLGWEIISDSGCPSQLGWEIISDWVSQSAGMGDYLWLWMSVSWDGRLSLDVGQLGWEIIISQLGWEIIISQLGWESLLCGCVISLQDLLGLGCHSADCSESWPLEVSVLLERLPLAWLYDWGCKWNVSNFSKTHLCQISGQHIHVKFQYNTFELNFSTTVRS